MKGRTLARYSVCLFRWINSRLQQFAQSGGTSGCLSATLAALVQVPLNANRRFRRSCAPVDYVLRERLASRRWPMSCTHDCLSRLLDESGIGGRCAPEGSQRPEERTIFWKSIAAASQCRATTTIMKVPGLATGRPVAPGFCSSNSAVARYTLCISGSTSIVLAPTGVVTVCWTSTLPGGLARNFKLAVSATRKRPMTVELRSIHAGTDRRVREHLAVVSTHHNQLLRISTSDKQSPFLCVD